MTPAARLAAAASILDRLDIDRAVEPQLRQWARANRYAGSKDRRAIADRVYLCLRHRRSYAAIAGGSDGRALVLASLREEDGLAPDRIAPLLEGPHALGPLSDAEAQRLSSSATPYTSEAARLDWPEWLWPQTKAHLGTDCTNELVALRQRATLDLRVNTLKADLVTARLALAEEGIETETLDLFPLALRAAPGSRVTATDAYARGWVEPQDAGSQAITALMKAKPNQTILDYCAGAGGKTLALAAAMEGKGTLLAWDAEPRRMEPLDERAKRAGATVSILKDPAAPAKLNGRCDQILVDAPCSGSGSWRRDPAGKWRLTPQALDALIIAQREALTGAVPALRQGGVLTYATCSILHQENEAQSAWFVETFPEFSLLETISLRPERDGTDGFFAARFQRDKFSAKPDLRLM